MKKITIYSYGRDFTLILDAESAKLLVEEIALTIIQGMSYNLPLGGDKGALFLGPEALKSLVIHTKEI